MCGKSKAIIDGCKIKMRLGYHGGSISINENGIKSDTLFYGNNKYRYDSDSFIDGSVMRQKLVSLGADNLAMLILHLVDNGAEL